MIYLYWPVTKYGNQPITVSLRVSLALLLAIHIANTGFRYPIVRSDRRKLKAATVMESWLGRSIYTLITNTASPHLSVVTALQILRRVIKQGIFLVLLFPGDYLKSLLWQV